MNFLQLLNCLLADRDETPGYKNLGRFPWLAVLHSGCGCFQLQIELG